MDEKTLIGKIEILGQIKPRKSWVILTKKRILGEERTLPGLILDSFRVFQGLFFQYRLALASLILILVLGGTFAFAQKSLPGEPLFIVKKITEKTRAVFVAENEKPRAQLELANKRLEELTIIAHTNQVKKLAPAISEFQANVSEAAQKLVQIKEPEKTLEAKKALVEEFKKMEEKKKVLASLYGVEAGKTEEMCQLTEQQIKTLGTLTEKQEELLAEAKKYLEEGECSLAFEKILYLSYPQEK